MKSIVKLKKTYHGYDCMVMLHSAEIMEWYCGYVRLPDTHPYAKLTKKKSWTDTGFLLWKTQKELGKPVGEKPQPHRRYFHNGYDQMDIDVHGGLTFCDYFPKDTGLFPKGAWIGWDYAHYGDGMMCDESNVEPKHRKLFIELKQLHDPFERKEIYYSPDLVYQDCKDVIKQLIQREEVKKYDR